MTVAITSQPASRWGRIGSGAGLACVYVAVALWWLWPVAWHAASEVPGPAARGGLTELTFAELYLTLWGLVSGARGLVGNPAELFHPPAFHPERYTLAYSEHMLGHQPLFGPLYALCGNPVLALNGSLLVSTALLGLGTHLLVRRWGGSRASALAAGVLAVAAPWRVGPAAARIHTLWVQYLPFILLFLDRYLGRRRRLDLVLAGLCLVLQILASYYTGYAAVIMAGIFLLGRAGRAPDAVARASLGMIGAVGAAAVLSYPYVALSWGRVITRPLPALERLHIMWGAPAVVTTGVVGVVAVVGALLRMVPRRWLRPAQDAAPVGSLLAIALAGYVLALGPAIHLPPGRAGEALLAVATALHAQDLAGFFASADAQALRVPLPYAALASVIPGFGVLRAPWRFAVLPATILPVLAGLGFGRVGALLGPRGVLVPLGVALAVLLRIPALVPAHIEAGPDIPEVYRWLAANGHRRPLLELPLRPVTAAARMSARAMYFSPYHGSPVLNGYGGFPPPSFWRRMRIAERLPHRKAARLLCSETGLGWILLHRDRLPLAARRAWDSPPSTLRPVARFGDDVLFAVTCPVQARSEPGRSPELAHDARRVPVLAVDRVVEAAHGLGW